ncbi:MAG: hypothetical protein GEU96_10500 [Propionibacteriales bacterium]|nr:hypothetical protein [Propionibacteriales bacterium]
MRDDAPAGSLPYVDEHAIRIPAARELVWTALQRYVATDLLIAHGNPLARILGTEPHAGFEVSESTWGESLALVGRHRFSRYLLRFELVDATAGDTHLRAQTYAAFPGVRGRVYRALVIGTRAHDAATTHVLRSIRRQSVHLARQDDLPA